MQAAPGGSGALVIPQGAALSGLFSAGTIADALGSLIAERFKQEAEMEALRNLGLLMVREDQRLYGTPLSVGLPKTMAYLKTLEVASAPKGGNGGSVQMRPINVNDWAVIQSSFKVDVVALPNNLPAFLDTLYGDPTKIPPHYVTRYLTWLASTAGTQIIRNGRNPYEVLDAAVAASEAFQKRAHPASGDATASAVDNIDTGLHALSILSHLLTKDGASTWHSAQELQQFLRLDACVARQDCDSLYLLLGLSYARDSALYVRVDRWLGQRGNAAIEQQDSQGALVNFKPIVNLMGQAQQLAATWESVHEHVHDLPVPITNIADARQLVADFGPLIASTLGTLRAFVEPPLAGPPSALPPIDSNTPCAPADVFCKVGLLLTSATDELQAVVDIIGDINSKQYAAAVGEIIAYLAAYQSTHGVDSSGEIKNFLSDNGPFIAAVAAAQSSDDLNAALENYSLPAGSYTQQQGSKFSVTLNSFFGVAVGAETLSGNLAGADTARTRTHLGFAAPVGLDFNFGQATDKSKPPSGRFFDTGAWSVFVPILDIGAVASWRLGSGGGTVSSITWQNIVAPGIYAVWSKRDSPFSVLVGAQYGPELRKVNVAGNNTIEKAAIQFPSIEFTFNIPIFNLYR